MFPVLGHLLFNSERSLMDKLKCIYFYDVPHAEVVYSRAVESVMCKIYGVVWALYRTTTSEWVTSPLIQEGHLQIFFLDSILSLA